MTDDRRHGWAAPRFSPVRGAAVGAVGGLLYWGAAEVWPASIAVVIAMLAMVSLDPPNASDAGRGLRGTAAVLVLGTLLKYDTLMALSAAKLPYALPENAALGCIMVAGQALALGLAVSVAPASSESRARSVSAGDLAIALLLGFVPATLIGIPGLIGLAAALVARFAWPAFERRRGGATNTGAFDSPARTVREIAEISFYLGVLGAWSFI